MCNEFCVDWSIEDTCALAAEAGYTGIELAPYTLAPSLDLITPAVRRAIRDAADKHHLTVVGLHWLLAKTQGLHINCPDPDTRRRTIDYYKKLIELCADLGGTRMIHGSPQQRDVLDNDTPDAALRRTVDFFLAVAPAAEQHHITLCPEPLARTETNHLNTKDQVVDLINRVDHHHVQLILDCKAMSDEPTPSPQLIREAVPHLRHFHANDDNMSYPGSGAIDFAAILAALTDINYADWISIEVFDFSVDPREVAIQGLNHLRAHLPA